MTVHAVLVIIAHALLLVVGLWLLVIDARTHRLPHVIVLPTLAASLLAVILEALLLHDATRLLRALAGMALMGGFYLVLRLISRGGMGGGDVKLAAVLGVVLGWHGWSPLAVGIAATFLLAALYALTLMALRRATGATRIALGPWMILGAILAIAAS